MTDADSRKVDMYDRVLDFFASQEGIVTLIPALTPLITKLSDLTTAIYTKDTEKESKTSGKSAVKTITETALENTLFTVSSALYSYGRKNNDEAIKAACDFSIATIKKMKNIELYNTAINVYNLAKDKALNDWDVEAEKIIQLKTRAEDFKKASTEIATAISERVGAGKSLIQLFKETDDLVKLDIDPVMDTQLEKRPEFYNGYKSARVIWDRGGSHKSTSETPAAETTTTNNP